jgi:amino acid transporter
MELSNTQGEPLPAVPTAPYVLRPLKRRLGFAGVLFLTLSVATPASSVFVIIPGMFEAAGTGAALALLLAALICVTTALIYAELSSAWPVAGGEYVMVAQTLGPAAGFAMLGVNAFNNLLFPPVAALGVSAVLGAVAPGLPEVPVAVAIMVAATGTALLNIRVNAVITGVFLALEVVALAIVAWVGFAEPARTVVDLLLAPQMLGDDGTLVPATAASIGVATAIAIFALNGYGMAVYFGEEMHDAPRRIAQAILAALGLTLLLEAVPLFAGLAGAVDLPAFLAAEDPFGALVAAKGGKALSDWVAIGIVIAIVNAIIAGILATARFFYSTARDRSWGRPLDAWLGAIDPRLDSPVVGTLLIGAVGTAACLLPLQFLLVVSGAGLIAIYAGIALAVLVGRRSGATAHAAYRMPLFPLAPLVTLGALGYVVWTSWLDLEEGRPALIATAAQIALALGYYALVLRRRGGWHPRLPAEPVPATAAG